MSLPHLREGYKMIRSTFEILSYCSYAPIKDRGNHVEPSLRWGRCRAIAEADEGAALALPLERGKKLVLRIAIVT